MYTIDSTSVLDLADNDMVILYGTGTSPMPQISSEMSLAFNGGAWNRPGLTSSIARQNSAVYGLGYAEASTIGLTTFDVVALGGNAVVVKYTLLGDTLLRGTVGIGDYDDALNNFGSNAQSNVVVGPSLAGTAATNPSGSIKSAATAIGTWPATDVTENKRPRFHPRPACITPDGNRCMQLKDRVRMH